MENLIVAVIVGLTAVFLVRKFYRSLNTKTSNPCGCGCSGCRQKTLCEQPPSSGRDF